MQKAILYLGRTFFNMILGPINLLDCFAFVIFLIPQLLIQVNTFSLIIVVAKVLPFLSERHETIDSRATHAETLS